ncbi:hypothetical protein F5050DRAFT_1789974 [Lentinula boryana]|uniref:Uncharacterized protein n=1 Tax=Lentinula boryana TaxID=40481 RepID=A0ABQ8Q0F9_9AGAR|nr:hypothetical protein F5050DRAFT_1789974 [Lentinula boryana]
MFSSCLSPSYLFSTSTSCPSISSSYSSSDSSSPNVGAIAGGIIGGLGFLSALIFFTLWFRLRKEYNRKPDFGQTVKEANANGTGNGSGAVLTPIIVPPYHVPSTQAAFSSISPSSATDISSPISRQQGTVKRRLPDAPMPGVAHTPTDPTLSPGSRSQSTFPSSHSQHTRGDSGDGVVRELSDLRREVQWLRHDIHGPPPSY